MAQHGNRWGVAVSGGPDSIALLEALTDLAAPLGIELGVVHVNHKLRGAESDEDETFVRERAHELGLAFEIETAAVGACDGENLEAAARRARYSFFTRLIADGTFDRIATGHTQSDQAETVLFRVLRGTGLGGLAAVRPTRAPGIVRPLIDVTREEVVQWLGERKTTSREDSSNQDTRFSRNRIRHELMPQLTKDWNPRITQALARLGSQAAAEEDYWTRVIEDATKGLVLRRSELGIEISCAVARQLDPAVLQRCLDQLARGAKSPGRQLDTAAIENLRAMTELDGPDQLHLPGLNAQRSCEILLLRSAGLASPHYAPTQMRPGEELLAPDGQTRVTLRLREDNGRESEKLLLDRRKLPSCLHLRAWKPGDKGDDRLLRDMFRRSGIPAWERERWPVLVAADTVMWSRGFGVCREYASTPSTEEALEVTETLGDGREIQGLEDWLGREGLGADGGL